MPYVIDLTRDIDAPAAVVWDAITDVAAYPAWNPFVVGCRTTWKVGEPIEMKVQLLPWFTQSQRERIFEHVPMQRLCYGLDGGAIGAVASRRCHELEAAGPSRTRYRSRFEMSGWLAGVVRQLLGARLEHGFTSMTDALVRRAEQLARGASARGS